MATRIKGRLLPFLLCFVTLSGFLFALPAAYGTTCAAGQYCGTIYFTTYDPSGSGPCASSACVGKVSYVYNPAGPTLTLSPPVIITSSLPHGSDGIVFDPLTGDIIAGENDCSSPYQAYVIDPSTGSIVQDVNTGSPAFHLMVDPTGTKLWASSDSGSCFVYSPDSVALSASSPFFGAPSSLTMTGSDTTLSTIMWQPSDSVHAFYTSNPSPIYDGFGHFGTIDLSTGVSQCITDPSGGCHTFQAAHGGGYDPYTGDILIFGSNAVTQIAPTPTPLSLSNVLGTYADSSLSGTNLDQGGADGFGHLFVADNSGYLFFEDYRASGNVASPTFVTSPFLIGNLDDLAPISGAGSTPGNGVPQFPLGISALLAFTFPLLWGIRAAKLRKGTD